MERIKGVNVLKAGLLDFMEEIIYSITCELQRIGRRVEIKELKFNPPPRKVRPHIKAISLDDGLEPFFDTSFAEVKRKSLRLCIADLDIDGFTLLGMLEMLKAVAGKNGALASIFRPVAGEYISHEDHDRYAWVCVCGNTPDTGGFYSCDEDGDLIEPGDEWKYLYRCDSCGRVIDDRDLKVIGINSNPNREEPF